MHIQVCLASKSSLFAFKFRFVCLQIQVCLASNHYLEDLVFLKNQVQVNHCLKVWSGKWQAEGACTLMAYSVSWYTFTASGVTSTCREGLRYRQPPGPNPLCHRDDFVDRPRAMRIQIPFSQAHYICLPSTCISCLKFGGSVFSVHASGGGFPNPRSKGLEFRA